MLSGQVTLADLDRHLLFATGRPRGDGDASMDGDGAHADGGASDVDGGGDGDGDDDDDVQALPMSPGAAVPADPEDDEDYGMAELAALDHSFVAPVDGVFQPSEFQRAVLERIDARRARCMHKTGLIVMATAAGKTILALLDVERELRRASASTPVHFLFLVHSTMIRDMAFAKFSTHLCASLGLPADRFLNVSPSASISASAFRRARFIFCLFQSFDRLPAAIVDRTTHVLIDEVHHVVAVTYRRIHDRLIGLDGLQYMVGMTATLSHRTDPAGVALRRLFRGQVYINMDWLRAKELGFFPRVEYLESHAIQQTRHGGGRTYASMLADWRGVRQFLRQCTPTADVEAQLTPSNICHVLAKYQARRVLLGQAPKRRMIVFARDCRSADAIAERLVREHGWPAAAAHYRLGAARARANFERFSSGDLHVLVTVNMINEGFDVVACDLVLFGRTTTSEIVFVQQMGRGLRKSSSEPDKELAVLDLACNLRRRWRRLRDDLDAATLSTEIRRFWDVKHFYVTPDS